MTRRSKSNASAETVAALFRLALAGKTRAEAAVELGLSYGHCSLASAHHKIPFRHGQQVVKPKRARNRHPIGAVKSAGLLDALDWSQRVDAVTLIRRGGYAPDEALTMVGRPDLAEQARALMVAT